VVLYVVCVMGLQNILGLGPLKALIRPARRDGIANLKSFGAS